MFARRTTLLVAPFALLLAVPVVGQKIGASFAIGGDFPESHVDVAYSSTSNRYLVVWHRRVGSVSHVRARLIAANGSYASGVIHVTTDNRLRATPAVAYVRGTNRMVIVWQERFVNQVGWNLVGRVMNPVTGGMTGQVTLVSGSSAVEPDVGGSTHSSTDKAVLVWNSEGNGIRSKTLVVRSTGDLSMLPTERTISTGANDSDPAISKASISPFRLVVAWTRNTGGARRRDVMARQLNGTGSPMGNIKVVAGTTRDERNPAVDSDGARVVIAWQRQQAASTRYDIYARFLTTTNAGLTGTQSAQPVAVTAAHETAPAVSFAFKKFLVAWSYAAGLRFRGYSLDSLTPCGGVVSIEGPEELNGAPAIASRRSGLEFSDEALVAYTSKDVQNGLRARAAGQRVEAIGAGGRITDLGGGCGFGGSLSTFGPFAIGNDEFRVRLNGASPAASLALLNIAAPGPVLLSCGGCQITRPTILVPLAVAAGNAFQVLPVPCATELIGTKLQLQCYVPESGTTPCVPLTGFAFSNRLEATVGQ